MRCASGARAAFAWLHGEPSCSCCAILDMALWVPYRSMQQLMVHAGESATARARSARQLSAAPRAAVVWQRAAVSSQLRPQQ